MKFSKSDPAYKVLFIYFQSFKAVAQDKNLTINHIGSKINLHYQYDKLSDVIADFYYQLSDAITDGNIKGFDRELEIYTNAFEYMCNNKLTVFEPNGMEMLTTYNSDIVIIEASRKLLSKLREYRSNCNLMEITQEDTDRSMYFLTAVSQISNVLKHIDEARTQLNYAVHGGDDQCDSLSNIQAGLGAVYSHHYKILTKNK